MLQSFIEQYSDRAFQFAYRLCGNAEEARELAQEAFVRLFKGWDKYDSSQPLEAWFLTILRNVHIDAVRRYDRRRAVSLDRTIGADPDEGLTFADTLADERDEAFLDALEREETSGQIRSALESLSPEHRAVLVLCDMEGLTYEDISRVLECPLGTVRSRVNRARAAFRQCLAGPAGEGIVPETDRKRATAGVVAHGV